MESTRAERTAMQYIFMEMAGSHQYDRETGQLRERA